MHIFLSIIFLWVFAFSVKAQISPDSTVFRAEKFMSYVQHTDSLNGIHYQVGTYNPDDSHEVHLPIYLRIVTSDVEKWYFLDSRYDPDMFSFPELSSDKLVIIKGRYAFYVYDIQRQTLSRKLRPGLNQYEGEDAISGLYSALTLFDNERFLLGNVQGFGIFCYDISNPAKPIELMQYTIRNTEEELPFYAFFHKTADNLFDILISQPDTVYKSVIPRLYNQLKTVHYMAQGISLEEARAKFSIPPPNPVNN